jgi:hypothetical protein
MKASRKKVWVLALCWSIIATHQIFGQQTQNEVRLQFRVRYVTPDAVYFNSGRADGVRSGDHVWVTRNGERLVQLEVKYLAEHSASCPMKPEDRENLGSSLPVQIGDGILWLIPRQEFLRRTAPSDQPEEERRAPSTQKKGRGARSEPKRYPRRRQKVNNVLNGQISTQAFGQKDKGPQRFDFLESSAYWRLHFERPGGLPLRLATRVRSSQNYRQAGATGMQKQPALHRVYEITLEYTTPEMPLELAVGRMLRNEMRGVGYLDGVTLGYRFNEIWKAGIFAGTQPESYRYEFRPDEKKLGGFLQMKTAMGKNSDLTIAATGVGRYIHQQVSREYLTTQVDFNFARQMYITQYLEMDFNRNWRRKASANAIDLSNAYFNTSYYPRTWISFGVSYDARRLVRTWETQSIADSLFDRALRQGWRANLTLQPAALTRITLDGSLQKHRDTPDVYSASIFAGVSNLRRSGVGISTRLSYFGNSLSAGYYPALEVSRNFFGVVYATLGGGAYLYRMGSEGKTQSNPWERLRLDINLTRRFFLSSTFENFHGNTMNFVRGFVDLGWRF